MYIHDSARRLTHSHPRPHTYTHTHLRPHTDVRACAYALPHAHTYNHTHMCARTLSLFLPPQSFTHNYLYTYARMHTCTHTHTHTRMHIGINPCIHTHYYDGTSVRRRQRLKTTTAMLLLFDWLPVLRMYVALRPPKTGHGEPAIKNVILIRGDAGLFQGWQHTRASHLHLYWQHICTHIYFETCCIGKTCISELVTLSSGPFFQVGQEPDWAVQRYETSTVRSSSGMMLGLILNTYHCVDHSISGAYAQYRRAYDPIGKCFLVLRDTDAMWLRAYCFLCRYMFHATH